MRYTLAIAAFLAALCLNVTAELVKDKTVAPPFTVAAVNGKAIRLSALRGKVVLLDFGALNCPPCKLEMPIIERWHKLYGRRGLAVVGLMEMNPPARDVKKMVKERGITYPVAVDTKEAIGRRYGLIAHPTTVLIDQTGRVVKAETGYVRGDEKAMEEALLALLGRQAAARAAK